MKASQYLYTSYKNSPNGGYAIYSMSPDISQEDAKVIFLLMQYPAVPMLSDTRRKLNNMAWNPVEMKDIEGVCPRNFAYFRLPSGKVCIAEAGYIGPEFKGFTPSGRTGNYLIHAFVTDSIDNLPILYLGSKSFRHDLTLDEWTTKTPVPLSSIEVSSEGSFSQSEISNFLSSNTRKQYLINIVTALKDKNNKLPIFINDSLENARLWISAISLLLSKDEAAKLTFNTYSYDDNNTKLGLPEDSKYRIQFVTGSSAKMKLQQKLFTGIVVDLLNNQFSQNLASDDIVAIEVNCLEKDIYSAAPFVSTIERIKTSYGTDNQTTLKIYKLEKEGISSFSAFEVLELLTVYSKASDIKSYCKDAFSNLLNNKYPLGAETTRLGAFIYPYLEDSNKVEYQKFVFNSFLNKNSEDPSAFINELKGDYGFIYKEFAHMYSIENKGKDLLLANENNRALVFLYLDSLLSDVAYNVHDNFVSLNEVIMKLALSSYNKGDLNYSLLLINKTANFIPSLKSVFFKSVIEKMDVAVPNQYLKFLLEVDDINYVANKLYAMLMKCPNKKEALMLYRDFLSKNSNFSRIDASISTRPEIILIIEQVEKQDFVSMNNHSNEVLQAFFKKYYLANNDKEGSFINALNKKLSMSQDYQDISFWLNNFLSNPVKDVDKFIYSTLLNNLLRISGNNYNKYRNDLNNLKRLGAVSSDAEVDLFAQDLFRMNEASLRAQLSTGALYQNVFNGVDDDNRKLLFSRKHLTKFIALIVKFKTVSYYQDAALLNQALLPFVNNERLLNDLYNLMNIERIDDEKYMVLLFCASKRQEPFSLMAGKIFVQINLNLSPKEKDRLSVYIVKNVRAEKDSNVFADLKLLSDQLNSKKSKQDLIDNAKQPLNTNVNVNSNPGEVTKTPEITNKKDESEEIKEKKGFFHNLFHKK